MTREQKKNLDNLWKQAVFKKYGKVCSWCGKDKYVQVHHMITRSNYALRWDVRNGVPLCRGHHFYTAHVDYQEFTDWFARKRPRDFAYIMIKRHSQTKGDYLAIKLYLEQQIEELDREVK